MFDFLRLTEWRGFRVFYFGDYLYSDLAVRGESLGYRREGVFLVGFEFCFLFRLLGFYVAVRLAYRCYYF